jgi:hypothetical protein
MKIRLMLAADGDRDDASIPPIIERVLGSQVEVTTLPWKSKRLNNAGHGYVRKLKFMIRVARDERADGLIAVIDCDNHKKQERLREMAAAREEERNRPNSVPTALGEANPHVDAWLLDSPQAIRQALGLPNNAEIVNVLRSRYPKDSLDELIRGSASADDLPWNSLRAIAQLVDPDRCVHSKETGLRAFVEEIKTELGHLASR